MTLIKKVNKELENLKINSRIVRSPECYYYFTDELLGVIPSIFCYNLEASYSFEEIMQHIKENLPNEN